MADVTLKVQRRDKLGKGRARDLRRRSFIPAILYGGDIEPIPLEVHGAEFEKALKTRAGENVILNLKIDGDKKAKKSHTAIIKDIQLNPVTDRVQHIDFSVISMTQKIRVNVPLHEKGEAPGAREGGVLDRIRREIEVECLPSDIPERIDIDVSHLNIGDSIYVRDLQFPSGVLSTLGPDELVCTVLVPMKEEVAAAPAEEAGPTEPEVIRKGKEAAQEAEAEAPEKPQKQEKEKAPPGKKE